MTNLLIQLDARRRQLGMTKVAVASRSRVSLPTVNRILSGREPNPALASVQAIASALGVKVVLGADSRIEEVHDAHEFRKAQATAKATALVRHVQGNMALEAQAVVDASRRQMIEQTANELLAGSPRRLWDD